MTGDVVYLLEWVKGGKQRVEYAYTDDELHELLEDARGALVTIRQVTVFDAGLARVFSKLAHPSGGAA